MTMLKEILTFRKKKECFTCQGKGKIEKCGNCEGKGYSYECTIGTIGFCIFVGGLGVMSGLNLLKPENVIINSVIFVASLIGSVYILKEHKEQTECKEKNGNKKSKNRR